MGIVIKQTFKGSIWSYVGVLIGALNVALLMPRIFSDEQIGLTNILVVVSSVLAQLSSLGINGVTNRFFPYFRAEDKRHNGYFNFLLGVIFIGFFLFSIVFYFSSDLILNSKAEDNQMLNQFGFYILPITFFTMLFIVFDNFNSVLYDSVSGTFIKEFGFRVLNFICIILFYFKLIDFDQFVLLYVFALSFPGIYLFGVLMFNGQVKFSKPNFKLFNQYRKQIPNVALFTVLAGLGGMIIVFIDKYMVNYYLGLAATGIYSVCAYVAVLIQLSNRSTIKVSMPLLAEAWKRNDIAYLKDIYYRSSIYQSVFGVFLFLLLWLNIDNIFHIIPERFSEGSWVIFFLGLSYLCNLASSLSSLLVQTSIHYRYSTYFTLSLMIAVVVLNIIFIPLWGITGAAVASFIANFLYVCFKVIFIQKAFGIPLFKKEHIFVVVIGFATFLVVSFLPVFSCFILDGFIRSLLLIIIYLPLIYWTKVTPAFNDKILKLIKYFC